MTLLNVEVVKAVTAPVPPRFIREVLLRAAAVPEVAARLPADASTVAIRLTDDAEMADLNRTYADEPGATDVLSFAGTGDHLGDIALSFGPPKRKHKMLAIAHR